MASARTWRPAWAPAALRKRPYIAFLLPGLILYTVFMIAPLVTALSYSFYDWSGLGPKTWVGLDNFRNLLTDPRLSRIFRNALGNNFKFVATALFVIMPIQLLLAYYLDAGIRGGRFFRLMLFLPYVVSSTIIGFFSLLVFDPNIGILNTVLRALSLRSLESAWLGDPRRAFGLLAGVIAWQGVAAGMLIFLANLKDLPREIAEASIIDGAGPAVRFWRVTLPQLGPSLTNNIVLGTIWALTIFDIPYVVGGPQGGVNNSIDFLNLFFYRFAFGGSYYGETSFGFGSTISVVSFLIILGVATIQLRLLRRLERI